MPTPVDLQLPHLEDAAIVIDARATEPAWDSAPVIEDWVVYWPAPDGVPEVHARARMLTDERGLYVFYEVIDPAPEKVRARISKRDQVWGDDVVGIYLDPAGQAQCAYLFFVNPVGCQADATRLAGEDDEFSRDGQWDSAGRVTETGFEVEFFIPWTTVRHPADMSQLGISLLRSTGRTGERSGWPRRDPDISGILVQENLVGGPGEIGRHRGLQLVPSLTAGWTDQGPDSSRLSYSGLAPGMTVRYDPSPALTLLATANPDFSQVESDRAQVDVNQRHALYFDEKRPFFLEGREWFNVDYQSLVYTRSMTQPRYGARATVETGDWQVAALHVMDSAPQGSVSEGDGWDDDELLDASGDTRAALDTVARARRSMGGDGFVGAIYSDKALVGGAWNRVGGVDGRARVSDSTVASGALLYSATTYKGGQMRTSPAGQGRLEYEGKDNEAWIWGSLQPADFMAENGYVIYSDWVGGELGVARNIYPKSERVPWVSFTPFVLATFWRPSTGELRDLFFDSELEFRFSNNMNLGIVAFQGTEVFDGESLQYRRFVVFTNGTPTRWLAFGAGVEAGEGPHYETGEIGALTAGTVRATFPLERVRFGQELTFERLAEPGGDLYYSAALTRSRVEVYATRNLWARVLFDYDSFEKARTLSALGAWQTGPARAVYLGGSLGDDGSEALSWQVFAKASWVFQI